MKTSIRTVVALLAASLAPLASAGPLSIAQYPLFLSTAIRPNFLVIMDNSESMDGTMAGKLIAGDDPTTRGNIARSVIRNTITSFSGQFNWGLESFYIGGPGLYSTYPYWLGNDTTMVFTDDCVAGISASNSNLRCIANPQWAGGTGTGDKFVTYDRASDDPDINDVLYIGYFGSGAWATTVGLGSGTYNFWFTHNTGPAFEANLTNYWTGLTFTPTDAGYIPFNPPITRQLYAYRAWGFYADVFGAGLINEPIMPSTDAAHLARIQTLLGQETQYGPDIKNASVFTPLAGSFNTARDYFAGSGYTSPITLSCQKNFVMLATDGNPTARSGSWNNMYPLSEQANIFNPTPTPGNWTFSTAANDVFNAITPLRSVTVSSTTYDIQTYVVGLGDTVANPSSIAALNEMANKGGTTKAYLAADTASLAAAFLAISNDIAAKTSAAAAVSLNAGSWGTGVNLYQARFNSGDWTGQLIAYAVNSDGSLGTKQWDAGQTINGQSWDTSRVVLTYKPSAAFGFRGVPFRWPAIPATPTASEMDLTQSAWLAQDAIGIADASGPDRVQYLRGNTAMESLTCPTCVPQFRSRPVSRLGDIIHSAPYYVAAPPFGYPDSFEASAYSAFAAAKSTRTPVIYVGANDGMLHGFDASSGKELLAYVPTPVFRNLSALTGQSFSVSAGAPHHYYVDGSPTVGDVFYGSSWHTLLVGALAAGGQGLYALDVTDPGSFSEVNAKSIVRWEFTDADDPDLGAVFGQPLIVKTKDGKWSVVVGNGYNNTDSDGYASTTGHAVLFVLDAQTGAVVAKIDTGVGTVGNPNGLSGPIAIDSNSGGVADTVYAGDLYGNMWKFDLSSASPAGWKVAFSGSPLFATPGSQPITVRPDVSKYPTGGYVVTFGTGRYLDVSDPTTTATQTFYGIRDDGAPVVGLSALVNQSIVGTANGVDGNTYRITTHAVGPVTGDAAIPGDNAIARSSYDTTKHGWYLQLPDLGERAVTEPAIRTGRVIFNTLIPNTDPCGYGGSGWVMELDVMTGNRYDAPTFDTNNDKSITGGDRVTYGTGANITSGRRTTSIPAAAGFLGIPKPKGQAPFEDKYVNTSGGSVEVIGETAGLGSAGRASWRQVQ
jgi:type IV pilus assembly protein PilY1